MTHSIDEIIKGFSLCSHIGIGACLQCPYDEECRKAFSEDKATPIWKDVLDALQRYADIADKLKYEIKQMTLRYICIALYAGKSIEFSEADEFEACEDSIWYLAQFDKKDGKIVIEELDEDGDRIDFQAGNELDIMQSMLEYGYTHPWYFVRTRV